VFDVNTFDSDDLIARYNTSLGGRRLLHRGYYRQLTINIGNHNTDTGDLSPIFLLEILIVFRLKISAMRIKPGQHLPQ
jgi:hypothetical protein